MALTDTQIKKCKPIDKAYRISDAGGLYIWITPAGGKLWRWAYTFNGKEKLMSFGKYPDVTLALARQRHAVARVLLAQRIDPMAERKATKVAGRVASKNSFASVSDRWFDHWKEAKSSRHVDSTRRRLITNILPFLGTIAIEEIEPPQIVAMIRAIDARGARDIAKRSLETTGQIFRFAIAHGLTTRNAAAEIRPRDILKPSVRVNHARVDRKELPALLRRIEVYQGTHLTRLAMKLIALTFVRTSELIEAKWSEFDIEEARWDIPAERMKMRSPHVVPLARQTLELLDVLRLISGSSEFLFPGDRNQFKPMSNNTILKALERMGYKGRMTGHGFRGIASTILHEHDFPHEHIELQLAHAPRNAVSAAYNHALYLKQRTKLMQDWADFLEQAQRGAKILAFNADVA